MEKSTERLTLLLHDYFKNSTSDEETAELWDYALSGEYEEEFESILPDAFDENMPIPVSRLDPSQCQSILNYIFNHKRVETHVFERKPIRIWPRIAAVAALVTIIFGAGLFFYRYIDRKEAVAYASDVAPGRQDATLILANGNKIRLSNAKNGELVKESGVSITKSTNGQLIYQIKEMSAGSSQMNTLSTGKGETYQLRLPDGSLVWLNAASSLTFSTNLNTRGKRRVKLDGEGYFEVSKDKKRPFIVESRDQEVEVLGTHFNINSYANEPSTKTALLEGSIRIGVFAANGAKTSQKMIRPGEQAVVSQSVIKVEPLADPEAIAWKEGLFRFEKADIKTVMRQLQRWYNIVVIYDGDVPQVSFSGNLHRNLNLSEALKVLEHLGVKFKLDHRKLTVYKQ